MSLGYSVARTARLVCGLRWACGRVSEILGAWAGQAAAAGGPHAGAAVRLLELSRRLALHRETLDGLQPDSERMAAWRQASPADQALVAALDEIAALQGPSERLAVAETVLVPALAGVYREIGQHAAPHCDAALASAVRALLHDLDREAAVAGAGQPGTVETAGALEVASPVEAAGRVLTAAGGIVGPDVLRPGAWA